MARRMPPLAARLASTVGEALQLAEAGERIREKSPQGSVGRLELRVRRLEALYETAYLRIFLLWEDFLEESFLRYLCGYESTIGPATLRGSKSPTLSSAAQAVIGTRDYVSWANPNTVASRSRYFMNGALHETVLNSNLARLVGFVSVRNRIAHSSDYARQQFDSATIMLVGRRFPASSPGRFLRHIAVPSPTPETWLQHIAAELKSLAFQICP